MKEFFKKFDTHDLYENYIINDPLLPNVSYCKGSKHLHYNGWDWEDKYLTLFALTDSVFTFTMDAKLTTSAVPSISYSIDNGETWVTTNNIDNQLVVVTTPTILAGNEVLWKSNAVLYSVNPDMYPGSNLGYSKFSSSGYFRVEGNIMSLLYGDDFKNKFLFKTLVTNGPQAGVFSKMFSNNTRLDSVKNLILPATVLTSYCYYDMFSGCSSLINTPKLPAINMSNGRNCYANMFKDCTVLTTAPDELPATTLADYCYQYMFSGCTSLEKAPDLPALALVNSCYNNMFYNCSNLNYVKAMFTSIADSTCLSSWLDGVSSTGTFVKNSNAIWNITGSSGIPEGWTVETANN